MSVICLYEFLYAYMSFLVLFFVCTSAVFMYMSSTKLGWRKFRRRISEFIATLAEFSPVIILLDRRQFCQCREYENAATAENRL